MSTYRVRIGGGKRTGEITALAPGRAYLIGRGSEANLRFPEDPYMSRGHAQLLPSADGRGWIAKNLSQHGLLVAGQMVKDERLLKPSDVLLVGTTLIIFELADPTSQRPASFPFATSPGMMVAPSPPPPPGMAPVMGAPTMTPGAPGVPMGAPPIAPTQVVAGPAPQPAAAAAPPPLVIPATMVSVPVAAVLGAGSPAAATPAAPVAAPPAGPDDTQATAAVVFLPGDSRELTSDELAAFDLFKGIPAKTIEGSIIKRHKINDQPPIWLRRYAADEVICHEGDYGSTAYFIVKGKVFIGINKQKEEPEPPGFFARLFGRAPAEEPPPPTPTGAETVDPKDAKRIAAHAKSMVRAAKAAAAHQPIAVDAPVQLPYDQPVGELEQGDLFGEMSCMSFYPRSATCVAGPEGVEVLEMLRSVLDFIRSNAKAAYKERIEKNYRERTLAVAMKSIPLFQDLPQEGVEFLKPRVTLSTFAPDTSVYAEGDAADALYIVRLGFVKVSQKRLGGEVVLSYVGPGQHFGETGVVSGGQRQATCRALDHVELIRIARDDFVELMKKYPSVGKAVERIKAEQEAQARLADQGARELPLGYLLEKGVMNAQNLLAIDLDKCTRCDECVRACADAHDGVTRLIRDGLRLDRFLLATACRACTDPVCMIGCPVGSIRRRNSLEIVIEDWCIGCGKCAQQCPYGNIHMHPYTKSVKVEVEEDGKKFKRRELTVVNSGKGRAATCDLCGSDKEPRCVYACPHGAAKRGRPLEVLGERLGVGVID